MRLAAEATQKTLRCSGLTSTSGKRPDPRAVGARRLCNAPGGGPSLLRQRAPPRARAGRPHSCAGRAQSFALASHSAWSSRMARSSGVRPWWSRSSSSSLSSVASTNSASPSSSSSLAGAASASSSAAGGGPAAAPAAASSLGSPAAAPAAAAARSGAAACGGAAAAGVRPSSGEKESGTMANAGDPSAAFPAAPPAASPPASPSYR